MIELSAKAADSTPNVNQAPSEPAAAAMKLSTEGG